MTLFSALENETLTDENQRLRAALYHAMNGLTGEDDKDIAIEYVHMTLGSKLKAEIFP